MRKQIIRKTIILLLCLLISVPATCAHAAVSYAQHFVNENQGSLSQGQFTWDRENKKTSWHYATGFILDAISRTTNNKEYIERFYRENLDSSYHPIHFVPGELDSLPAGIALFDILDDHPEYANTIWFLYRRISEQYTYENYGGNYLHKQTSYAVPNANWADYPIALDSAYMADEFLIRLADALEEGKLNFDLSPQTIYEEMYNRLSWMGDYMYDEKTGLYNHGYSVEKGRTNGICWSRGMSWYLMTLADVIPHMPERYKGKLTEDLKKGFDGLLSYQTTKGLWRNVPAAPSSKEESSGTAMFAYSMLKSYDDKTLTEEKYLEAGEKAFNGLKRFKKEGVVLHDIKKASGVNEISAEYEGDFVDNDAKGAAAYILAEFYYNKITGSSQNQFDLKDIAPFFKKAVFGPSKVAFTGNAVKPHVKLPRGIEDKDYSVTCKNNVNVGRARAVYKGRGSFSGRYVHYFTIIPPKPTLRKITASKRRVYVRWRPETQKMSRLHIAGYEIQYASNTRFTSNAKTVIARGYKRSRKAINANGKCFVRVRAFMTVSGKKYYSKWSTAKAVRRR